jgi:hypothetical protein
MHHPISVQIAEPLISILIPLATCSRTFQMAPSGIFLLSFLYSSILCLRSPLAAYSMTTQILSDYGSKKEVSNPTTLRCSMEASSRTSCRVFCRVDYEMPVRLTWVRVRGTVLRANVWASLNRSTSNTLPKLPLPICRKALNSPNSWVSM